MKCTESMQTVDYLKKSCFDQTFSRVLFFFFCNCKQLNQQSQTKADTKQDYKFLTDSSSIYVTSLAGNHVGGTTTLTTSKVNLNTIQSQGASSVVNQSHISQSLVHVHQPPAVRPLAGGWLIGDSPQGTPITANEQQVFQNILNNNNSNTNSNNISVSSAGGTIVYSSNSVTSASESASKFVLDPSVLPCVNNSNLNKLHGNSVDTQTETTSELLANGYGPKKDVSIGLSWEKWYLMGLVFMKLFIFWTV